MTDVEALAPYLNETAVGILNPHVNVPVIQGVAEMSKVDEPTTVPKAEHSDEASFSDSSPDPDEQNSIQENAQVQKRKGGRKPVCFHT